MNVQHRIRILSFKPSLITIAALLFSITFAPWAFAKQMVEGPTQVVYKLYRDFAWEAVIDVPDDARQIVGAAVADQPLHVLENYFDHKLSALLVADSECTKKANGEICNLDFDPIFGSQDNAASDLTIDATSSGDVDVRYVYPSTGKKVELLFKVVRTSVGYRIRDIVYMSNGGKSLTDILQSRDRK